MLKIILSNIRKHKSSMISLFILIILASMLLCIGLTMSLSLNNFFYEKLDELNAGHVSYYVNSSEIEKFVDDVKQFPGIKELEAVEVILGNGVTIPHGDSEIGSSFYFENRDKTHEIAPLIIIDESSHPQKNAISLPLVFRDSYGYKTDELIKMKINGKTYEFKINGFFEDVYYGSPMMGFYRAFLSDEQYKTLKDEMPQENSDGKLILMRLDDRSQSKALSEHFTETLNNTKINSLIFGVDLDLAKTAATTAINILGMIVIGFSFIVVIVALIVVGFSIATAIEEGIVSIGILKALGYKNKQMIGAMVLQYGLLSLVAASIGIIPAMILLPSIGNIAAGTAGLLWQLTPSIFGITLSLGSILGLVILVAFFSARKTRKITPIAALRNGVETHNFRKNFFPLSKWKLNVSLAIALKSIFGNIKQTLSILLIVVGITFAGVFSLQLYGNMVEDKEAFNRMMGFPPGEVWFTVNEEPEINQGFFDEISKMEEVEKTLSYEQELIKFEDLNSVGLFISDDYENSGKKTIIEGRYPIHENEIAVSATIAKRQEKEIGDMMSFSLKGKTQEFLITGLTEQMTQMGLVIDISEKGYRQFDPDYQVNGILISLKEGINKKEFIEKLDKNYDAIYKSISDIDLLLANSTASLENGIMILMIAILIMMVMVVSLILFLIIKVKILRDKMTIGILKATGFTSFQLTAQIALSFSSIIGVGAVLGGIFGGVFTNPVINILFSSMGINNASFNTNLFYIVALVLGTTLYSFVISALVAGRNKKITPYHLFTDK